MSRIGNTPITVPSGVDIDIAGDSVTVKGPKGTLEHSMPETISVAVDDGTVTVSRDRRRTDLSCAARAHPFAGEQHGRRCQRGFP